jgi:hypothetical protein
VSAGSGAVIRRGPAVLVAFLLAGCGAVLAGCGGVTFAVGPSGNPYAPLCKPDRGELSGMLVLVAQALPKASAVPCVQRVPAGWGITTFDAHDGGANLVLSYLTEDNQQLTVDVLPRCEPGGAVEQVSDEPLVRRFDRKARDGGRFADERFYTFAGGCTRLRFGFSGTGREARADEIGGVLGFLSRAELDRQVREYTGGRLHLDPPDAK